MDHPSHYDQNGLRLVFSFHFFSIFDNGDHHYRPSLRRALCSKVTRTELCM